MGRLKEWYPSLHDIMTTLGMECIVVGSASRKPITLCKDLDFVISDAGQRLLAQYDYFLDIYSSDWKTWIPYEDTGFQKAVDFFHGICDIEDISKYSNRISYADAIRLPLNVLIIEDVEVLSIRP